jgi:biopolymer transport protein ExbD/biopolymer transport protein TolR
MGMPGIGGKRGILSEVNVVPLIDILLVLLVIFMIIPHQQMGLQASLPQQVSEPEPFAPPDPIVVRVAADGTVRINGSEEIKLDELRGRLEKIFALRANRVAFLQGDRSLEFQAVAQVLDLMHVAGVSPVGLLSSELEKNR